MIISLIFHVFLPHYLSDLAGDFASGGNAVLGSDFLGFAGAHDFEMYANGAGRGAEDVAQFHDHFI